MPLLSVILAAAIAAIGPLTDEDRIIIETAYDGRDHKEQAYITLAKHAAAWTEGAGAEPVRLDPDFEAMLADPDAFRGDLCRLAGRIEQQTPLEPPYDMAEEWFIRNDQGRPILVYVAGLEGSEGLEPGAGVEIFARFYKRVDAMARDGQAHSYPAFVGALPQPLNRRTAGIDDWRHLWIVAIAIVIMLIALLLLMMALRRTSRRISARRPPAAPDETDEEDPGTLPDDPAAALDELKRRAENGP
ncbi:MAG: hypothetical protein JSV91_14835 [Phycisphaerales bacterium]|nr:MAG: hypothetical protein JSV91_14835 [Phycisphaerales bacterium]